MYFRIERRFTSRMKFRRFFDFLGNAAEKAGIEQNCRGLPAAAAVINFVALTSAMSSAVRAKR